MAGSFCQYLYNALDDYGLRTISLNKMIAAQGDNTSDHDNSSASCDGRIITCGQYLKRDIVTIIQSADKNGKISAFDHTLVGYTSGKNYKITVLHKHCEDSRWEKNSCDTREQGFFDITVSNADGTGGDSTSGDGTSGDSTSSGQYK